MSILIGLGVWLGVSVVFLICWHGLCKRNHIGDEQADELLAALQKQDDQ